jgi:C1A family cysteine protease
MAPLNPAFVRYVASGGSAPSRAPSNLRSPGIIPPPIDLSHLGQPRIGLRQPRAVLRATSYPATYDLRTTGRLGPAEDQGLTGCCWDFAAMDALESSLVPGNPQDFSEDNLALASGFDRDSDPYNKGGNASVATAYLARWGGPMSAAAEPFGSGSVPAGLSPLVHVQNVLYLPLRTSGVGLDNDAIKWGLMNHGAVDTDMLFDGSSYDETHNCYYYSVPGAVNHAVDIVGWDDSFSRYNFSSLPAMPPADGAFIVRNSWGPGFGDAGYFYISYYDAVLGTEENTVFCGAEPTSNYSQIYQYDPLGWTGACAYPGSDTAWFGNQFTAASSGWLSAVAFYAPEAGSSYEVYRSDTPGSMPYGSGPGTIDVAGYHTIPVSPPVWIPAGRQFFVSARLTAPGGSPPIALEAPIPSYSSAAVSSAGESFVSSDGSAWDDLQSLGGFGDCSVCVKAFMTGPKSTRFSTPGVRKPVTVSRGMYVSARLYGAPGRSRVAVQVYNRGWKTRVWAYTSGGLLRKTLRLTTRDRGRRKVRVYYAGGAGYRASASKYVLVAIR